MNRDNIGLTCLGTGLGLQATYALFKVPGNNCLPPISDHIGDYQYPYILGAVTCSIGTSIDYKFETNVGYYISQAAPLLFAGYISLGESFLPRILSGTADPWDIPAAVLGGVMGFLYAKYSPVLGIDKRKNVGDKHDRELYFNAMDYFWFEYGSISRSSSA